MSQQDLALFSPTELHGEMCGALSANAALDRRAWAADWVENHLPRGEHSGILKNLGVLLDATAAAMNDESFEFELKLPDDDEPLLARAQGLARWCAGYLSGIGESLAQNKALPADVKEVLIDVERIARTVFSDEESDNDAEADLTELIEYVRVGALLVFEHFRAPANAGAGELSAGPH